MSDDDTGSWFETSSNADENHDRPQPERRLEAVPEVSESSGQSDWFEQEVPAAAPTMGPAKSRSVGPKALFVAAVLVVLVVLAGAAWFLASLLEDMDSSSPAALTVPTTEASAPASEPQSCEVTESDTVTTGDGEGDQDSVAGVILAFQHAYYVERDAKKMEPLLAKDSNIRDLDALQKGIDSVERGTTHCLRITPEGDKAALTEVTEVAPDGAETVFEQRVTTTRDSDRVRIVSIESVDEGSK
ncbi:hypothetical protein GS921_24330 [Rhodococcus hoagii]|nr:hypothetical protein [Prescottella equi]NKV32836.1 hypothetical protein [Prescottella equi]